METRNWRRVLAGLLGLLLVTAVGVRAGEWQQDENGDVYVMEPFVCDGNDPATFDWDGYFDSQDFFDFALEGYDVTIDLPPLPPPDLDVADALRAVDEMERGNLNDRQLEEAREYLKQHLPAEYYDKHVKNAKIELSNAPGGDRNAAGSSKLVDGQLVIEINPGVTDALRNYPGSEAEFLAAVTLHESLHKEYYESYVRDHPEATQADYEATVRYYTEEKAIEWGHPESSPNARGPDGQPDINAIYDQVVNDGYSTDTGSAVARPPGSR